MKVVRSEATDYIIIKTIMQNLKFDIAPNDIERSHRIGQLKQPGEKQRRVKVSLVR